jgi:hypothetical protein
LPARSFNPFLASFSTLRAGIFNAFRGAYEINVWPQVEQPYLAVLSLRHPNISSSFRAFTFRLTAVTDPDALEARAAAEAAAAAAAAALTAKAAPSAAATAAAAAAAAGPVFNPLLQPRVALAVELPGLDAAAYGGAPKVLADFKAIVASTAVLDGPDWVVANLTGTKPVAINATVGGASRGGGTAARARGPAHAPAAGHSVLGLLST